MALVEKCKLRKEDIHIISRNKETLERKYYKKLGYVDRMTCPPKSAPLY
jgi:hypothetical protein